MQWAHAARKMTEQLPATDITPGLAAPRTLDWNEVTQALDRIQQKINALWPVVMRKGGGLFRLYRSGYDAETGTIAIQAVEAQTILDFCQAVMPKGIKIQ